MNAIGIIARLTWMRLRRGRAKWVSALLAVLPPLFAALMQLGPSNEDSDEKWQMAAYFAVQLPVLLATVLHLASAVGDELESKTYTYLWSRPMPRRALLLGKLVGTLPALVVTFLASMTITWAVVWQADAGAHVTELLRALLAVVLAIGASASLALVAGSFFPRHPLALMLVYVIIGEQFIGMVPAVQQVSIAYHAAQVSGAHPPSMLVGDPSDGVIGLVVLTLVWLGLALWKIERAEYALPDG
jgi:ABC-2 type transport system permease protein